MNYRTFKRRIFITGFIIVVISGLFIIKLFYLHFSDRIIVPSGRQGLSLRGPLKDRNGYILAMSIEQQSLFANPAEIEDPEGTAHLLSGFLSLSEKQLLHKLTKKKRFVWLKRKLDKGTIRKIMKIGLRGLYIRKESERVYPHGSLAANIIGFVGMDNKGLEGLEYRYNSLLAGEERGFFSIDKGIGHAGKGIILTIDRYIQYIAEKGIQEAVLAHKAHQGIVLVMEVKTGRVLALAKYPGFYPATYYTYTNWERRNFSVIDSFEPGSTLKILAAASMLQNHPSILSKKFICEGKINIADVTINCTGVHGTIGLPDIIRHSCNVGIIKAAGILKKRELYETLHNFGLGRKTGIKLPGESAGILRTPARWSGLSKYSLSIGHEISVTSVQLAAAFSAIGNGGIYIAPSIIEAIEDYKGKRIVSFSPRVKGKVINRKVAATLLTMMRGVVKNGTGTHAASLYYTSVGKTGTSKKYIRGRGYSNRLISSFVGLAPYQKPVVTILVIVDEPADRQSGGAVAAPVFSRIVDRILIHLAAKKKVEKGRAPQRKRNRQVLLTGTNMPDFRGYRVSEAARALIEIRKRFGTEFFLSGRGKIYAQSPAPGEPLKGKKKILLKLSGRTR